MLWHLSHYLNSSFNSKCEAYWQSTEKACKKRWQCPLSPANHRKAAQNCNLYTILEQGLRQAQLTAPYTISDASQFTFSTDTHFFVVLPDLKDAKRKQPIFAPDLLFKKVR